MLAARLPPPAAATEAELDEAEAEAVYAAQQRTLVKKKAAKAAQLAAAPKKTSSRRVFGLRRDALLRNRVRALPHAGAWGGCGASARARCAAVAGEAPGPYPAAKMGRRPGQPEHGYQVLVVAAALNNQAPCLQGAEASLTLMTWAPAQTRALCRRFKNTSLGACLSAAAPSEGSCRDPGPGDGKRTGP